MAGWALPSPPPAVVSSSVASATALPPVTWGARRRASTEGASDRDYATRTGSARQDWFFPSLAVDTFGEVKEKVTELAAEFEAGLDFINEGRDTPPPRLPRANDAPCGQVSSATSRL